MGRLGRDVGRTGVVRAAAALLVTVVLLGACSLFSGDEETAPQAAPAASAPPGSCEQQAQALGFQVIRVDPQQTEANGAVVTPVLVNWGRNGGVHLLCRRGPNGTVSLG